MTSPVRAQDFEGEEAPPPAPIKSKATASGDTKTLKIQFDDELVKGQQSMPEAEYVFTRSQFNYKKLIKLRENFNPEIEKGKDEFRGNK